MRKVSSAVIKDNISTESFNRKILLQYLLSCEIDHILKILIRHLTNYNLSSSPI